MASEDTIRAVSQRVDWSTGRRGRRITPITPNYGNFEGSAKTQCILVVRNAALNAEVLYFQLRFRFPSWTLWVRVPSPAP
jgi:hypothetical protein